MSLLNVSSKIGFCGMPLRADTSSGCKHGCRYCFANLRGIRKRKNDFISSELSLSKELKRATGIKKDLINQIIPIHWGGMSDPFQSGGISQRTTEIVMKADYPIMFSTKGVDFDVMKFSPRYHAFQFSIPMNDKSASFYEPNAPCPSQRIEKAKQLKRLGFWVAVRLQPFIPNITENVIPDILKVDWDYIVIEGIKVIPQMNETRKLEMIREMNLKRSDFFQFGLLNLLPQIRAKHYLKVLPQLYNYKIGMADNDFHFLSDSQVCCGTDTVPGWNSYTATTTAISLEKEEVRLSDITDQWLPSGDLSSVFTSNRTDKERETLFGKEHAKTTKEYFESRFYRNNSPFSPSMLHNFIRLSDSYRNPYWGKCRREILQQISKDKILRGRNERYTIPGMG